MIPSLFATAVIYIMNNEAVRLLLAGSGGRGALDISINERYFFVILQFQCWMGLALTAWIGPRLMSIDMSNGGLPTILSHPISRLEYVLAKCAVLAGFLSAVTWVPLLYLFGFQAYLSVKPWAGDHWHLLTGTLIGCAMWIVLLTLITLAVASWVRWRIVATGMVFAAMLVPAGMGSVFNEVMRTNWGGMINIPTMMFTLWRRLLHVTLGTYITRNELPTIPLLIALTVICAGCAMAMNARIRAREVVRG